MKSTIAIISNDILFCNLFIPLLNRKEPDLETIVCETYDEINLEIEKGRCNLIIVDGGITTISSIEAIQFLRSVKKIIAPVWFFPEIKTEAYLHKALSLGATKIVSKPFDPYIVTEEMSPILVINK